MIAYDVKEYQVKGPAWITTERYDVIAKVPSGATPEQVKIMWRSLLAERFGVILQHEPKDFKIEELVVGKGGPKLKETSLDPALLLDPGRPKMENDQLVRPGQVTFIGVNGHAHTTAKGQSLSRLTTMLSNTLDRPVLDKTGLSGKYDFELDFKIDMRPGPPGGPSSSDIANEGPDLPAAVEQQLGLKLVAGQANLDVLVIDQAEKTPTAN